VDHVRIAAGFSERSEEARGTLRVQLQRLVERLLEGDGRGTVDQDIDARDAGELALEVTRHRADVASVESFEDLACEQVLEPGFRVAAEEHGDARLGQLVQALREHGLADEPGGSRQQHRFARQALPERLGHVMHDRTTRLY
jgi:hypothetical protein